MKYRTVEVKLTTPSENIGDLMNILAITCFRANARRDWVIADMKRVLDEQYVQCLLNSEQKSELRKPMEQS